MRLRTPTPLLLVTLVTLACAGPAAAPRARAAAAPQASSSATATASAAAPSSSGATAPTTSASAEPEAPAPLAEPAWGAGVKYAPTRPSTLAKPPGACVDPGKDVARRMNVPLAFAAPIEPPPAVDLDGDGVADVIYSTGAVDLSEHTFLYVMRGPCGHFVGHFFSDHTPGETTDESANGLRVLLGRRASRTGAARREATAYRFDGTVYREAEARP